MIVGKHESRIKSIAREIYAQCFTTNVKSDRNCEFPENNRTHPRDNQF